MKTGINIEKAFGNILWLKGKWQNVSGNKISIENWELADDTILEGESVTTENGMVTFREKLKIEKKQDDIFYTAYVKHNPQPVSFKLVKISDNEAVFENPEHDFPQKISYRNEGNLHAWIEGPGKDGEWEKIDFYMSKIR